MTKHVPVSVRDVILPFDWDVSKVWQLSAPIKQERRNAFDYLLYYPLWSSEPNQGMMFDLSPMTVIDYPNSSEYQKTRLGNTDVSFPIDVIELEGQTWLLDGSHRIARLYLDGVEDVLVRRHSESVLDAILVP